MSDLERLRSAFASGDLIHPGSAPNLIDLGRAVANLCGAGTPLDEPARSLAALIGPADHLVFVLVDGLGMVMVDQLPDGSELRGAVAGELVSVFPSTTATALTSLATCEWVGRHAVTGWWTYLPEIEAVGMLLPYIRRSGGKSLKDDGLTPEQAFPQPSLLSRFLRNVLCVFPEPLPFSVYSTYFGGGCLRRGYTNLQEAVDIVLEHAGSSEGPTFTYLYYHRLDEAAHRQGAGHAEVRGCLLELEQALPRLAGHARTVVTADHGLLDIPSGGRHFLRAASPLAARLAHVPSGDTRVAYFEVRPGESDAFAGEFRDRYGEAFYLLSFEEAERLGLFGPEVSAATRARTGNFVAIASGDHSIEFRNAQAGSSQPPLVSGHSGLTPQEMRVPLILL